MPRMQEGTDHTGRKEKIMEEKMKAEFEEWLKTCKSYHKGNVFSEILRDDFWECWKASNEAAFPV